MSAETRSSPSGAQGASAVAWVREALRNRGFVACTSILIVIACGFQVLATHKGIRFRKEALPLKQPLDQLAQDKLAPYVLVRPFPPLQADMLDQLGTDQYVQWLLADPAETDLESPHRAFTLFATYYTGARDQAPHVPEVCYAASGHQKVGQRTEGITISVGGKETKVPLQVLQFRREGLLGLSERIVIYTFHCNGRFLGDNGSVRREIREPGNRYAYYSKVEVGLDVGAGFATGEDATEAGKRFLKVVLPVLVEDHWPDWSAAVKAAEEEQAGETPEAGTERN